MIYDILERSLKLCSRYGFNEFEVYVVDNVSTEVLGSDKGVERVVSGEEFLVGVRVVMGRRVCVYGGMVSKVEDVDVLVSSASKIVKTLPEDREWVSLPKKLGSSVVEGVVDVGIKNLDLGRYVELVNYMVRKSGDVDRRAFTTDANVYLSYVRRVIANSYGGVVEDEKTKASVSVNVKVVDGGDESGYSESYSGSNLSRFNPDELITKAVEGAVRGLRSKRVITGTYEVVLMPRVFTSLINLLIAPALCADQVQKGRSPLKGMLGLKVFSENITVVDDGTYPGMLGSRCFDDEGIPTKRKVLIDKGVLVGYLYDTYTANIESRESTGNAFRPTPHVTPKPWISNILVDRGSYELDMLVRELRNGLVVYDVIGMWLSNPVSGLLNATVANAVYVEGGEVKHPVKGVVITGDVYELLKTDEVVLTSNKEVLGRYEAPAIYIPKISVAGEG